MDARSRRPRCAEDGGGADLDAGEVPEVLGRGERDPRDAQGAAEVARHEGFVVGGDIKVEFRLLAVADENGFDDVHPDAGADVGAVFHRDAGVGVHAGEGDAGRGKGLIDKALQRCLKGRRGRGEGFADEESGGVHIAYKNYPIAPPRRRVRRLRSRRKTVHRRRSARVISMQWVSRSERKVSAARPVTASS